MLETSVGCKKTFSIYDHLSFLPSSPSSFHFFSFLFFSLFFFFCVIFHPWFSIVQFLPEGRFQQWVVVVSTIHCNSSSNESVLFSYMQLRESWLYLTQFWEYGDSIDYCMKLKDGASSLEHEDKGFCLFLKIQFLQQCLVHSRYQYI